MRTNNRNSIVTTRNLLAGICLALAVIAYAAWPDDDDASSVAFHLQMVKQQRAHDAAESTR